MNNSGSYFTDIGTLRIEARGEAIVGLYFADSISPTGNGSAVTDKAALEINHFLLGKIKDVSFQYDLYGTNFQMKVWNALLTIPYGETRTYKQIAEQIGHPKAARAVGNACNANPISIVVPCHRVISSDGSLGGYGGGLDKKIELLRIEKKGLKT